MLNKQITTTTIHVCEYKLYKENKGKQMMTQKEKKNLMMEKMFFFSVFTPAVHIQVILLESIILFIILGEIVSNQTSLLTANFIPYKIRYPL